jgi:hypothetical protein
MEHQARSKVTVVSFTVVPLHNLDLGAGCRIPFGKTFMLQNVPE